METDGERRKVGCGEETEAACCCGYEGKERDGNPDTNINTG